MTRRSVAPESVRAWTFTWADRRYFETRADAITQALALYGEPLVRIYPVRIVREADYRRLLRAAAGKREAKR